MSRMCSVFTAIICLPFADASYGSGGRMWRPNRVSDLSVDAIHVDRLDPARMYATGHPDGRLFGSRDGGMSWSLVWVSPPLGKGDQSITDLSVSQHVMGRLLATVSSGGRAGELHESTDYGRTWSRIDGPWDGGPLESVHEHPGDPDYLLVGDGQHLWRRTPSGWNQAEAGDARVFVYDPNSSTTYRAGERLHLSHDAGQTWSEAGGLPDGTISDVTIDEQGAVYVFVARVGLFRSRDAGGTWDELNIGRAPVASGHVHVLAGEPSMVVLGLSGHSQLPGVYISDDGGQNWVRVRTLSVSDIAPHPMDPSTFYASTRDMVDGHSVSGIDHYRRVDPGTSVEPASLGHVKLRHGR